MIYWGWALDDLFANVAKEDSGRVKDVKDVRVNSGIEGMYGYVR